MCGSVMQKINLDPGEGCRDGSPVDITDLDFAEYIALLSDNMADDQRLLLAVEHWALAIGL